MLVMATCSVVVDAAPAAAHAHNAAAAAAAATSATRIPGLEKIKHVVYFMQVSDLCSRNGIHHVSDSSSIGKPLL